MYVYFRVPMKAPIAVISSQRFEALSTMFDIGSSGFFETIADYKARPIEQHAGAALQAGAAARARALSMGASTPFNARLRNSMAEVAGQARTEGAALTGEASGIRATGKARGAVAGKALFAAAVVIDIYEAPNGKTAMKHIAGDAAGHGSAILTASLVGAAFGSEVPVVGTIVGAVAGAVVGIIVSGAAKAWLDNGMHDLGGSIGKGLDDALTQLAGRAGRRATGEDLVHLGGDVLDGAGNVAGNLADGVGNVASGAGNVAKSVLCVGPWC
ncbi:MAG: hypothetical protein ACJ72E_00590 [Marmoricola sp.]